MAALFILSILIIQLLGSTQVSLSWAAEAVPMSKSGEFIRTSCSNTTYPHLCITSLSGYATKIQTSPKLLAKTALSVALEAARSAATAMTKMAKDHKGSRTGRESSALVDCVEELRDAVDELQRALGEMGGGESSGTRVNDVETWLSSALTDDDTCLDGFSENDLDGSALKRQVVKVAHLTSIALALIHSYGSS